MLRYGLGFVMFASFYGKFDVGLKIQVIPFVVLTEAQLPILLF